MNWYRGTIQDAVAASKKQKAFFVVYVEGTDELSVIMTKVLDSVVISRKFVSNSFVAIKLPKGSEGHKQFEEFYKLVPVPSVFFIDQNGSPVEVVVSENSEDNVTSKLNKAIEKCVPTSKSSAALNEVKSPTMTELPSTSRSPINDSISSVTPGPSQETPKEKMSINVQSDATKLKGKNEDTNQVVEPVSKQESSSVNEKTVEERIEKAKILLEKKKEEKVIEDRKKEKEAELERRRVGHEIQLAKRDQQDRELRQLKEEREREKKEDALARERILKQIMQDRADRAERLAMGSSSSTSEESPSVGTEVVQPASSSPTVQVRANTSFGRLQFKLPTGESKSHSFPPDTTLLQVREFIDNNIVLPFSEYQLATTFPRREFSARDNSRDLRSLQLIPSAVILILPVHGSLSMSPSTSWTRVIVDMLWDLVQPVISLTTYIRNVFFRRGNNGGANSSDNSNAANSTVQPPSSGTTQSFSQRLGGGRTTIKRRGNIYSLQDNRDDNDENNTWNGNSTQQM